MIFRSKLSTINNHKQQTGGSLRRAPLVMYMHAQDRRLSLTILQSMPPHSRSAISAEERPRSPTIISSISNSSEFQACANYAKSKFAFPSKNTHQNIQMLCVCMLGCIPVRASNTLANIRIDYRMHLDFGAPGTRRGRTDNLRNSGTPQPQRRKTSTFFVLMIIIQ